MKLNHRAAFVTGGASGIGRAIALALAREGARVAVADVNADGARRTAAEIQAAGGLEWLVRGCGRLLLRLLVDQP